ncbi:MAG: lysophospholipid acyltransferase family protein [Candidatus Fimimonas sp.]
MKIKTVPMQYKDVVALPAEKPLTPKRPNRFFRALMKIASASDLKATNFSCEKIGMEKLGNEPCLILMNHSCFIDLKILSTVMYPRPINIVMTSDGFVGKRWLMRNLGCIPTDKFNTDAALVRNVTRCVKTLKTSVLLFPEASYSFDGTATPLPRGVGKLVKLLRVPVVMILTHGAFLRDPLYNGLQLRKVDVSATVQYLLSPQQIAEMSAEQINSLLIQQFSFDAFAEQQQKGIVVNEPFRADGLNRVLYKCPHCNAEGQTEGKGETLVCHNCHKTYVLDEKGFLRGNNGDVAEFSLVSDWYNWQRQCVRKELEQGVYALDVDVEILVKKGTKAMYKVGQGHLHHDKNGFTLCGCDGQLNYFQPAEVSYSLYSDFFWYEIADVICIGNSEMLYYCFPTNAKDVVAKARLATEELYKLCQQKQS